MKKAFKTVLVLCCTGGLSLSISLMNHKDLMNTEAASQSEIIPYVSDDYAPISKGDATIRVSAEDQTMVENSLVPYGFLQQKDGTVVFFEKVKN